MPLFRSFWPFDHVPAEVRRMRRVLRAGLRQPHYRAVLEAAGLGTKAAIADLTSGEEALARLPFSRLDPWRPEGLHTPELLDHPLLPGTRAIYLQHGKARYTALAGTLRDLRMVAALPREVRAEAEFGVLVLRFPGQPEAGPTDREMLWKCFQVPVHNVFLGYDGTVLAHECEAQCGYHATGDAIFEERRGRLYVTSLTDLRNPTIRLDTGMTGGIESGGCECGRAGIRLATAPVHRLVLASAAD
jgi:hypothetical protein